MGLRLQDPIPEWITHIALVHGGHVTAGEKAAILDKLNLHTHEVSRSLATVHNRNSSSGSSILVDMQNVNVRYRERHVRWYFLSYFSKAHWFAVIDFKRYQLDYPRRGSLAPPRRERYVDHYVYEL
jgi:Ni/Co efflux regulator RcnB